MCLIADRDRIVELICPICETVRVVFYSLCFTARSQYSKMEPNRGKGIPKCIDETHQNLVPGGPPFTRKSLTRSPTSAVLAYVLASGGFSR